MSVAQLYISSICWNLFLIMNYTSDYMVACLIVQWPCILKVMALKLLDWEIVLMCAILHSKEVTILLQIQHFAVGAGETVHIFIVLVHKEKNEGIVFYNYIYIDCMIQMTFSCL